MVLVRLRYGVRVLKLAIKMMQVGYGLDFPWKASLPRIETRMYLEQYGGSADVWIGKVLYRCAWQAQLHLFFFTAALWSLVFL